MKMQVLLEKTEGAFEDFGKKICEKVKGLLVNPFNRGGKIGVIKGLIGISLDVKGLCTLLTHVKE